jgi:hypothetical protein
VKISIYVIDVFYKDLGWRARNHTPRMATQIVDHLNDIEVSYEEQPGPLPPVEILAGLTNEAAYGTMDEFYIFHCDQRVDKSRCFDFGDFLNATYIEKKLGTDVGIAPCFGGDIRMRDHDNNNSIWAEAIRIMRSKVF